MRKLNLKIVAGLFLLAVAIAAAVWLFFQFEEGYTQQVQFRELSHATVNSPDSLANPASDSGYLESLFNHGKPTAQLEVSASAGELEDSLAESIQESETVHDLPALQGENPDCIGWVRVPGTGIDYPIMWTPEEPEKYLHLSYWGEYSNYGVPFLDARCTPASGNLILYGHNMFDGTMFTPVLYFTEPEVLASCGTIQVEIGGETRTYQAFAAAHITTASPMFRYVHLATPEAVADFLAAVQAECGQGLEPGEGAEFVTLVTCDVSREDGRAVVIGVREKESDT